MPTLNPFWHGIPIPLEKSIGRYEKLRSIANRISTGQSIAIADSPRCGKTSLLYHLMVPEKQEELYGDNADKLIFSYLDVSTWDNDFNWGRFWLEALRPLYEQIKKIEKNEIASELANAYEICQNNEFGNGKLKDLFIQLKQANKRFILMLDEFDLILQHPTLKSSANFFGGIRHVVSQCHGTLAVVISTNLSVNQLTTKTHALTGSGSPHFNFMDEKFLGAFSNQEINRLLQSYDFPTEDLSFIKELAGGHPYLLQVLASSLWQLHEEQQEKDLKKRQQQAETDFYLKVETTLDRIWQTWQESTQKAFMSVVLVQMEKLKRELKKQGINVESISQQLPRWQTELEFLKQYGFLIENQNVAGGWRVYPKIFLPFIIDKKLKPEYRDKLPPEIWEKLLTPDFFKLVEGRRNH